MEFQVGLLGAGFIADFHVQALKRIPGTRVTWVCDADPAKAKALAAKVPGAQIATDLGKMLEADDLDVVHVMLPPAVHAHAALEIVASGRDAFIEKPLATSRADALSIAQAAAAARRTVGVNHNLVFNPTFQKLVAAIRSRRLGELEHAAVVWNVPLRQLQAGQHGHWMFRAPGNILLEQAVHPLSMIHHLFGNVKSVNVATSGSQKLSTGALFHDTWQVSLVLERGTTQLFLGFGREWPEITMHAVGQDGAAWLDLKRGSFRLSGHSHHEPPLDDFFAGIGEGASRIRESSAQLAAVMMGMLRLRPAADSFLEGIRASVQSFYSALAAAKEPKIGAKQGAEVVSLAETIGLAAAESLAVQTEHA